jgi:hypothetical protein
MTQAEFDSPGGTNFRSSSTELRNARHTRRRIRRRLSRQGIGGELRLTGGSSLAGALTGGDVDLHLRVPTPTFRDVVTVLEREEDIAHPEIWSGGFATFTVRSEPCIGIAVTAIGGEHDRRFRHAWQRLRSDPSLLKAYNAIKERHRGRDRAAYERAKAAFFDALDRG